MVSDAPDGFLVSFELAVCVPEGTGVLDPEGVLVLMAVRSVGALEGVAGVLNVFPAGLVGVRRPVGVRGLEEERPLSGVVFLGVVVVIVSVFRPDIGVRRVGILDGVPSSVLSRDKLEPCLEGGLLLGRLPVRDAGRELGLEPPGVSVDLYEGFLGVRSEGPSVSERDSGVPKEDFDALVGPPELMGVDLTERSRTLVIGPAVGVRSELAEEPEPGVEADGLDLNAVID